MAYIITSSETMIYVTSSETRDSILRSKPFGTNFVNDIIVTKKQLFPYFPYLNQRK